MHCCRRLRIWYGRYSRCGDILVKMQNFELHLCWLHGFLHNCEIGAFCSIGPEVIVGPGRHPTHFVSTYPGFYSPDHPSCQISFTKIPLYSENLSTTIGSDVWIGARAIILDGISIGHGSIIGAGAVVTKDVEPYTIVGGVPARPLRKRFDDSTIDRLLTERWWEKNVQWIQDHHTRFYSPQDFSTE